MHELLKKYVKGDKYLWGAIFMLILISIVSVLSSSTMLMYKYESGVARFFGKHTCMQIVSIFAMIFLSRTHPRYFSGLAPFTLSIGIIGIFAALLVSESVNGSARWLNLGFMSFQPSEIAKFALVVYVAKTLAKNDKNPDDALSIARHEVLCSLEDVVSSASKLLVSGGHFYMVHRPFRLAEIFVLMNKYHMEPKRMQMIHPYIDKEPNMVLIDATKGGKPRLTVEKPLVIYKEPGIYHEDVYDIYGY